MISDLSSAILSWICFYYFRKTEIESSEFIMDNNYYLGLILIPLFWLIFYTSTGNYKNVYKKHNKKSNSSDINGNSYFPLNGTNLRYTVS